VKIKVRKSQRSRLPSVSPKLPLDPTALIVIGASTGGTEALKEVLTRLPKNIPPILIVQHIPPVFSAAFANRLNELCPFEVKEAENGDTVKPGRALIAPGGFHMRFQKSMRANHVTIDQESPVQRHRPSVDILFQSVARQWSGKTIAVILTGMGSDGAQGLSDLRKKGARTIAQDEESCVVFGMPKEAIRLGGAEVVSNLFEIPEKMMKILEQKKTA
jgi:two-component system chemotaxis response regulator CheB